MPIRPLSGEDIPALRRLLDATRVFSSEEVDVAIGMMEEVVGAEEHEDYAMFSFVDDAGTVRGYYCIGPVSFSRTTFDLYWIATDPELHGKGIGRSLIEHCERYVRSNSGIKIVAETSSRPAYDGTRRFYERCGFVEEARIRDYYRTGDDLVVYTKTIEEAR
ncbi:MAG: GNAT family N-acetyltransferase [Ignavibacteria bacterium]|nr:GNAT family N-acetyltransferase [Ignavibacteria bacterium]